MDSFCLLWVTIRSFFSIFDKVLLGLNSRSPMPFLSSRSHFWLGIEKMIAWQQGRKWRNQSCPENSLPLSIELYLEGVSSPRQSIGGLQMGRAIPWVALDRSQENTWFSASLGGMERTWLGGRTQRLVLLPPVSSSSCSLSALLLLPVQLCLPFLGTDLGLPATESAYINQCLQKKKILMTDSPPLKHPFWFINWAILAATKTEVT